MENLSAFFSTHGRELALAAISGFVGAFGGAWGGAWAAQRIAKRAKDRETILQEIKNTNAAIETAANVFSTFASFKEQLGKPLQEQYDREKAVVVEAFRQRALGAREGGHIDARPDVNRLELLPLQTGQLEEAVLKSTSVPGRARTIATMLSQTLSALNTAIASRNSQLQELERAEHDAETLLKILYGVQLPNGAVHNLYGDTVGAISVHTNASIYFAYRLCQDLARYGGRMQTIYTQQFRQWAPGITKVSFGDAFEKRLIPPLEDYATWEQNFYERIPRTVRRRTGKLWYALRKFGRRFTSPIRRRVVRRRRRRR